MIHLIAHIKIFIIIESADFRKWIDGLYAVFHLKLVKDPRSGIMFVFINRNKVMIMALTYNGTEFIVNNQVPVNMDVIRQLFSGSDV